MALSGEIDIGVGCFLQPVSGVRRTPLFRFSLMVIEPAAQAASGPPRCLRWKDIVDWRLIGTQPHNPIQQLIDRNLQRFGRREPPDMVFDYFETQIAMVEAGVGCAVIPTFAIPACRQHRIAMHPLTDPMVPIDLCQITSRGRKQPPGFEDFAGFLKSYIAEWAEPWSPKFA
jgi:DNA-binding transcriptional LysR family regulator